MKNYKFAEITATNGQIYRTEKIDLINNQIFKNLKTSESIKKAYESFLLDIESKYPNALDFRVAETPIFVDKAFKDTIL